MRKADECWSKLLQYITEVQMREDDVVVFTLDELADQVDNASEKSVERTLDAMTHPEVKILEETEYGGYIVVRLLTDSPQEDLLQDSEEYRKNRMRWFYSGFTACPTCGSSRDVVGYSLVE